MVLSSNPSRSCRFSQGAKQKVTRRSHPYFTAQKWEEIYEPSRALIMSHLMSWVFHIYLSRTASLTEGFCWAHLAEEGSTSYVTCPMRSHSQPEPDLEPWLSSFITGRHQLGRSFTSHLEGDGLGPIQVKLARSPSRPTGAPRYGLLIQCSFHKHNWISAMSAN